jgi:uncharacterized protein YggU (UPF0235/DUF167 family)
MKPGLGSTDRSGPAEVRLAVRLVPRGGADRVDRVTEEGELQVRVAAPPVGGAANAALVKLLAAELDLPRSAVRLVAGATGRRKLVVLEGVAPQEMIRRWPGLRL